MPFTIRTTPACAECGGHYRTLFPAFKNDRGFIDLCGKCVAPATGPAQAYTGPYPMRSARPAPTLRLIAGGAAQ